MPAIFNPRLLVPLLVGALALASNWHGPNPAPAAAAVTLVPSLTSPVEGERTGSLGPTLTWQSPPGATQYHLQVVPFNGDGSGIDLHLSPTGDSFAIPPPPRWYGLLPDITYSWRVRLSDATTFVTLDDPSWGPWGSSRFRTPLADSTTITAALPIAGSSLATLNPVLVWNNSTSGVFYYEVQVSKDSSFNTDGATATAMVYWELRHGGISNPPNSYTVPSAFPLDAGTSYYWRVRPRLQGDGIPVAWSNSFQFKTSATAVANLPPTDAPPPAGPPAIVGPRIMFVSQRDGLAEVYAVRPDGTGLVNLSNVSSGSDEEPVWSPDGSNIAFISDRDGNKELYVMKADGSGQLRLTKNAALDCCADWSPDGAKLTFISRRDGAQQVYVVNADGSGLTRITNNTATQWSPLWSPKGNRIAYGSSRNGNLDIFVANSDGTGETNLSNNASAEYGHAWSPDGAKIAFQSIRDGNYEVYIMNADGAQQTNLTNSAAGNDLNPVWSPDGKKIAFVSTRDGNDDIYVMNADGTGQRNLTTNAASECCAAWSADGTQIAFSSDREGSKRVYTIGFDGTGLHRLTKDSTVEKDPRWAPR